MVPAADIDLCCSTETFSVVGGIDDEAFDDDVDDVDDVDDFGLGGGAGGCF